MSTKITFYTLNNIIATKTYHLFTLCVLLEWMGILERELISFSGFKSEFWVYFF